MARTRTQQVKDCGSAAEARKYADGARDIISEYQAGQLTADDALFELRWELGAGDNPLGIDIDDPFLTATDRRHLNTIFEASSEATIQQVHETR